MTDDHVDTFTAEIYYEDSSDALSSQTNVPEGARLWGWMRDSAEDEPQRPITPEILLNSALGSVIQLYTTATENTFFSML